MWSHNDSHERKTIPRYYNEIFKTPTFFQEIDQDEEQVEEVDKTMINFLQKTYFSSENCGKLQISDSVGFLGTNTNWLTGISNSRSVPSKNMIPKNTTLQLVPTFSQVCQYIHKNGQNINSVIAFPRRQIEPAQINPQLQGMKPNLQLQAQMLGIQSYMQDMNPRFQELQQHMHGMQSQSDSVGSQLQTHPNLIQRIHTQTQKAQQNEKLKSKAVKRQTQEEKPQSKKVESQNQEPISVECQKIGIGLALQNPCSKIDTSIQISSDTNGDKKGDGKKHCLDNTTCVKISSNMFEDKKNCSHNFCSSTTSFSSETDEGEKQVSRKHFHQNKKYLEENPPKIHKSNEEVPKKRKRGRPIQPMGWPKRPLSAYNLFFRDERKKIIEYAAIHQNGKHGYSFSNLTKHIAAKWKQLPKAKIARYEMNYYENKEKYERDVASFKKEKMREIN